MTTPAPSSPRPAFAVRLPLYPLRLTYVLLAVVTMVFVAQYVSQMVWHLDLVMLIGAKYSRLIAHGQLWRLFTPIFIHAGWWHFLLNAYALYNLGTEIERTHGAMRLGLIFLLSGVSGTVASTLFSPAISVGASGAIFGLIGALGVFLYRNRNLFGERGRRSLQNVIAIAGMNLFLGMTMEGIDNWAHIGGLVGGVMLSWFIGPVWEVPLEKERVFFGDRGTAAEPLVLTDKQPLDGMRWMTVGLAWLGLLLLAGLAIVLQL